MKKLLFLLLLFFCAFQANAQETIDKVVAVVGDEIVLKSEIEAQMQQMKDVPPADRPNLPCFLLDNFIQKKLLLVRAKVDSLKVSDDQVDNEMDRRLNYFIGQLGSQEKLEQYYNKSIREIKDEFRKTVKEQLLSDQMQNKVLGGAEVTPGEVKKYFQGIPQDSLPFYNTEVEVGQIVIFPKVQKDDRLAAIEKLRVIRQEILDGASFGTKAVVYSKDEGSALRRGDLGMAPASTYVPEFSAAALKLKKDSISDIVETKFGFHIIQMVDRKGDNIHVRHILVKPDITAEGKERAKLLADSVKNLLFMDKMKFNEAVQKFSEDADTRNRGGLLADPKTQSSRLPVDELDGETFFTVDALKVGDVSDPVPYKAIDGQEGYRLLYLKSKTPPHKANLKDDYPKLRNIALEARKMDKLQEWMKKFIPITYIRIDPAYSNCESLKRYTAKNE